MANTWPFHLSTSQLYSSPFIEIASFLKKVIFLYNLYHNEGLSKPFKADKQERTLGNTSSVANIQNYTQDPQMKKQLVHLYVVLCSLQ